MYRLRMAFSKHEALLDLDMRCLWTSLLAHFLMAFLIGSFLFTKALGVGRVRII